MGFMRDFFRDLRENTEQAGSASGPTATTVPLTTQSGLIIAAAAMNSVDLHNGRVGKSYAAVGTPARVLDELGTWLIEAMRAKGSPVPFSTSIMVGLLQLHHTDTEILDLPYGDFRGYAGVAFNLEDSLHIIVLNPIKAPVMYFAFSDHPHPTAWNALMELPDVTPCAEPPAPWGAKALEKHGVLFYEGAFRWLYLLEVAFANLFMVIKRRGSDY